MPGPVTPTIGAALAEAALLTQEFENTPLWQITNVREGAITIQQQAARFASATDYATREDAAGWAREGYIILSAALPDTHTSQAPDERQTGWSTAHHISQIFGPEFVWLARVRLAFTPASPDSSIHDPSTNYLLGLLQIAGLSQREAARRIGISERMMRYYLANQGADHRPAPYTVQFTLESLARAAQNTHKTMLERDDLTGQLGTMPDSAIAKRIGAKKDTIAHRRIRSGIPAYCRAKAEQPGWRVDAELLGAMSDTDVAQITGRSISAVCRARRRRGIARYDPKSK